MRSAHLKRLHLENPERGLQYSSEGVRWVLKGPPEGSIYHGTSASLRPAYIFCCVHNIATVALKECSLINLNVKQKHELFSENCVFCTRQLGPFYIVQNKF